MCKLQLVLNNLLTSSDSKEKPFARMLTVCTQSAIFPF